MIFVNIYKFLVNTYLELENNLRKFDKPPQEKPSVESLETPSGDPMRRIFGNLLRRAFEKFLKPPKESHHFKVHVKAEWLSGLRRQKCERM